MKLALIARGRWEVAALLDDQDRCPVLDLLAGLGPSQKGTRQFLDRFLRVYLPLEGPPSRDLPHCQSLGGGIFELRRAPGPQPRILFFQDRPRRIVCTHELEVLKTVKETDRLLYASLTGELT